MTQWKMMWFPAVTRRVPLFAAKLEIDQISIFSRTVKSDHDRALVLVGIVGIAAFVVLAALAVK